MVITLKDPIAFLCKCREEEVFEKIPDLRRQAKRIEDNFPASAFVYNIICFHVQGFSDHFTIYRPQDPKYKNSTITFLKSREEGQRHMALYCAESEVEDLRELLTRTCLIDWLQEFCFYHLPEYLVKVVEGLDTYGSAPGVMYKSSSQVFLYNHPKPFAPLKCPAGLRLYHMGTEGLWVMFNSYRYKRCINMNKFSLFSLTIPCIGLYHDPLIKKDYFVTVKELCFEEADLTPISWASVVEWGAIAMINSLEPAIAKELNACKLKDDECPRHTAEGSEKASSSEKDSDEEERKADDGKVKLEDIRKVEVVERSDSEKSSSSDGEKESSSDKKAEGSVVKEAEVTEPKKDEKAEKGEKKYGQVITLQEAAGLKVKGGPCEQKKEVCEQKAAAEGTGEQKKAVCEQKAAAEGTSEEKKEVCEQKAAAEGTGEEKKAVCEQKATAEGTGEEKKEVCEKKAAAEDTGEEKKEVCEKKAAAEGTSEEKKAVCEQKAAAEGTSEEKKVCEQKATAAEGSKEKAEGGEQKAAEVKGEQKAEGSEKAEASKPAASVWKSEEFIANEMMISLAAEMCAKLYSSRGFQPIACIEEEDEEHVEMFTRLPRWTPITKVTFLGKCTHPCNDEGKKWAAGSG